MEKNMIFIFLCVALSFSCSNDKLANDKSSSIIGQWKFTNLEADGATGNVKLANDILHVLVADGCNILSFDFTSDLTVTSSYRDFTQMATDVSAGGTELLIQCPESVITETTVWELEGNQLTFMDANGGVETITIQLDDNILIVPGEILDEVNLAETKAVFARQ